MITIGQFLAIGRTWMGAIVQAYAWKRIAPSRAQSRVPRRAVDQAKLRALSPGWLALCLAMLTSVVAQAGLVEIRVLPKHQFTNGGLTQKSYDTPEEAWEAGKPVWSNNPDITSVNMRPATSMGPPYSNLLNGVTFWHMSDTLICGIGGVPGNCDLYPGTGFGIQTNLQCEPGFGIAHEFSEFYIADQKSVCLKQIYTPEPCDDCDGRGNPVLPSTGQKLQV